MRFDPEIVQANREYHPCENGVHICGWTSDESRPLTIANVPNVTADGWAALKASFALPDDDDFDLLVDWFVDGSYPDQFAIRRQSLDAVLRKARDAANG